MPAGRPSKYSEALAARLCAEVASGKSLRTVCKSAKMPSMATVFNWIGSKPEFLEQYEICLANRSDTLVEDMLDIADDPELHPQDKRVRVDTRKWIASKMKPKKYGDRITHSGDDEHPLITRIETVIRKPDGNTDA